MAGLPEISPEYVSYADFPEILLFYGSHELFYPHVARLIHQIRRDGGQVKAVKEPMCHDWAICSLFPEGRRAIRSMQQFIIKVRTGE